MKILVTGGAGFIGSHVVDRYIALGHEVMVIDDLSTGVKKFVNPRAKLYQVDIRQKEKILDIIQHEKPEVLNHHAAQMDVRRSVRDPQFDAEVNILGFLNLLEAGRKNDLKQIIFASSGGTVYGDTEVLPTSEHNETRPKSPYGISKLTSEEYLSFYYENYGINYAVLRYGNVYGPRQNPHGEAGVVAIFCKKMLSGEKAIINGDGEQSRDFVFVEDVVYANETSLLRDNPVTVNIGTSIPTSINQLAGVLSQLTNSTEVLEHGQEKSGEQKISVLDNTLAAQVLGWKPKVPLEEGLRRTVAYFQHEKDIT